MKLRSNRFWVDVHMPARRVAFLPAAKEPLPQRRPSFFKSKMREWWDAVLAAPSDEEAVSDIVDQEEPKHN
jgi:hypothetical protein